MRLIGLGFVPWTAPYPLSEVFLIDDELEICIEYENGKVVFYAWYRKTWRAKRVESQEELEKLLNDLITFFPTLRIGKKSDSIRKYHGSKISFSEFHIRKLTDDIFILNRNPHFCTEWDLTLGGSPPECLPDFLVNFPQKKDLVNC
jgi:hypothetical protein